MHKWTDDAKLALENYLQQVTKLSSDRGDDSQEIVEGLRDHITREAEANAEPFITAERVRLILAQLGSPEAVVGLETNEYDKSSSNENSSSDKDHTVVTAEVTSELERRRLEKQVQRQGTFGSVVSITFQVFVVCLAFAAIFIAASMREGSSRLASPDFGDNLMPTLMHFLGLLVVPLAIIYNLCLLRLRSDTSCNKETSPASKQAPRLGVIRLGLVLGGYVMIVSFYYMILFLPLLPFAVMAAIFLIGLLPLAPYFTFFVGFSQLWQLCKRARMMQVTCHWMTLGIVVAFAIYGGWAIHHEACTRAIKLAISPDAAQRERGVRRIKALHGEQKVLRGCYGAYPHPFNTTEIGIGRSRDYFSRQECQTLYYRMTGLDYRSATPPGVMNSRDREEIWSDWAVEGEIGGDVVGARVPDLSLKSSSIDAVIAGDRDAKNAGPCVAYVQWVLEFKNDSARQREARCQIQMPPGSVGSRLTLWINGEEKEAAVGKRAAVKEAYREVAVRQRRDPALLTTDGADRLLLQCFPIEPHSTMKVKVGMSIPLTVREFKTSKLQPSKANAILRLPYMADRNFAIAKEFNHNVWAEGVAPMQSPTLDTEQPKESHFAIRGKLTESDLRDSAKAIIILDAPERSKMLYTAELHGFSGTDILVENQPFEPEDRDPARTVAIVVDTSRVCKESLRESIFKSPSSSKRINWDAFFKSAPSNVDFSLFVGENLKEHLSAKQASKAIIELIAEAPFDAADEQTGNLEKAWDLCAKSKHGLVLWIHGPMPVELSSCENLTQQMTRRPGHFGSVNPRIASLQIVPGPNLIEQNLDSVTGMFRVPIFSSLQETLDDVAKNLNRPGLMASRLEFNFHAGPLTQDAEVKDAPQGDSSEPPTAKSSDQIVRIALGQKVYRESQTKLKSDEKQQLADEAAKLRLITPLTGAVVLEQAAQYAKHGLDPDANIEATSDIPEPETWVLLVAIFVAFIFMVRRQRASLVR